MPYSRPIGTMPPRLKNLNHNSNGDRPHINVVRSLLETCGFVAGVAHDDDFIEQQTLALGMLADMSPTLTPSRCEVFHHYARQVMVDGWGWKDWEARDAIKAVLYATPRVLGVQKAFSPRTIDEMLADPDLAKDAEWLVPGYVGRGIVTLVSGHPKVGKSTFLAHLVRAVAAGEGFLGEPTVQVPVLWLNLEQHERRIVAMFRDLNAQGLPVNVSSVPAGTFTDDQLVQCITDKGIGVVVIDSLSKFWDVEDENDATQTTRELGRLLDIARETQAAIVPIHHLRKSGGTDNLDVRGSGAINAVVDVSLAIRKHKDGSEAARELETISRYDETPDHLVVELADGVFRRLGTVAQMKAEQNRAKVLAVLSDEPATAHEIGDAADISRALAAKVLNLLSEGGEATRVGAGKKGNPFRFTEMLSAQAKLIRESACRNPGDEIEGRYADLLDPVTEAG